MVEMMKTMRVIRLQYSVRTLMIAIAVFGLISLMLSVYLIPSIEYHRYESMIQKAYGTVSKDLSGDLAVSFPFDEDCPHRDSARWLSLLSGICDWSRITELSIDERVGVDNISDAEFAEITKLSNLATAYISTVHVSDSAFCRISKLRNLRTLRVQMPLNDAKISCLKNLRHLTVLGVYNADLEPGAARALQSLPNVTDLIFWFNNLRDDDLLWIAKMPRLRTIFLQKTKVTDAGILHLSSVAQLEMVDADDTNVTAAGAVALKQVAISKKLKIKYGHGGVVE